MEPVQETLLALSWPAAVTIICSVATIVIGIFGYLISVKKDAATPNQGNSQGNSQVNIQDTAFAKEGRRLHDRISNAKEMVSKLETDVRVMEQKIESIQRRIEAHEERDSKDFNQLNSKIDKLTDIVFNIIADDK